MGRRQGTEFGLLGQGCRMFCVLLTLRMSNRHHCMDQKLPGFNLELAARFASSVEIGAR